MTCDSNVCLCICVCVCVFFSLAASSFIMMLFPYTRMYGLAFRGLAGACMYFVDPHSTRAARYIYSYIFVCMFGFVYTHLCGPVLR